MQKKKKARKIRLRTMLLSVITVALIASIATFVGVGASGLDGDNVSGSDKNDLLSLFSAQSTNGTEVDALPSGIGEAQIVMDSYFSPFYFDVTSASPIYLEWEEGILLFDTLENGVYSCKVEDIFYEMSLYSASPITVFSSPSGVLLSLKINSNADLTELNCSYNGLRELVIDGNSNLKKIDCHDNDLTSLDFGGLSKLEVLDCSDNGLTELDLSGCTSLKELDCSFNKLTCDDISPMFGQLTKLVCGNNPMSSFSTVGYANSLEYLDLSYCEMKTLDISNCSSLTSLNISENWLRFDSVKLPSALNNSGISGLDNQRYLLQLKLKENEVIDISSGTGTVYTWYLNDGTVITPTVEGTGKFSFGSEYLGKIVHCVMTNSAIPDMQIITSTLAITNTDSTICQAKFNNCKKGDVYSFNVAVYNNINTGDQPLGDYSTYVDWGDGKKTAISTEFYVSDDYYNFIVNCQGTAKGSTIKVYTEKNLYMELTGNALSSYDLSGSDGLNGFFVDSSGDIDSIDLSNCDALYGFSNVESNIGSLDFSNCAAMTNFYSESGVIGKLDFSGCSALEKAELYDMCLTESIDLSGCNSLKELHMLRMALSEIDLSDCTELTTLNIVSWKTETRLKELDLTKNTKLEFLQCVGQDITALDLSKNTAITNLFISGNKLRFSKLKLWDGWESADNKYLMEQTYDYSSEVPAESTIDLSSEYSAGGNVTKYQWYSFDTLDEYNEIKETGIPFYGDEITPASSANGKFTFDDSAVGKYVYCKMTNDTFPEMDIKTTLIKITEKVVCKHPKTTLAGKKAATCSEEGYTGDKVCTSCGEVVTPGTSIEKIPHTFKTYVSNNDATCMSDGTKTAKCTKCDVTNTITDFGTKQPHTYGICTYIDENTHSHTCLVRGCGYEETVPHRGGTATYTEQAVCMSCNGSYGELIPHDIKLNIETITLLKDKTFAVTAYKYPSNSTKAITWTSSNEAVATVNRSGTITAVAKGKATITAVIEGGSSAQIAVTVIDAWKKSTESITINKPTYTLTIHRNKPNPTVSLSAKIKGNSTGKLWYSDNINVATVNKSGKVTAVGAGTATIYCCTASGEVVSASVITVDEFRIDSYNMHDNIVYLNVEDTCSVRLTNTTSDNSEITWKSSNTKIASVDQYGNVTAHKKGTVTITVTTANKSKDTCKLVVVNPTESIKLNKTSASIYVGKSVSLKASPVTRGSNEPVFWTSSNSSIATVSSKGVVKGLKQGTVTITATSFNEEKETVEITVMSKAAVLEFTETTPALFMGGHTGTFTVKITSPVNSNDTIKWSTSNKNVIDITNISADGKTIEIKSGKKGTATITAKAGSGKSVKYKVTSVNQAAESMTLNKTSAEIYVGKSVTFKAAKILPKGCNDIIIWSTSNKDVATVTPDGVVKGVGQGDVTITATQFGTGEVVSKIPVKVMTKAVSISVDKTTSTIAVNGTDTIRVTEIVPVGCNDKITWSISNKSVVSVTLSSDGKTATVTGLKKGSATITVKTGSGKSKKIKVTVTA